MLSYSAWIFYLSSGVVDVPLPDFPFQDKILHTIAYGILASISWLMCRQWPFFHRPWFWAWLYTTGYGITDEWHQFYVPGRYSDVLDGVADAFGAALFISILEIIRHRHETVKDPVIPFHSQKNAQRLAQKLDQIRNQGGLPQPGYREKPRPHLEPPNLPPSEH